MTQKLIIDVDTGIDDALAILYALGEKNSDLIGLTTTYGNIGLEEATRNSLAILDLVGAHHVPVYKGAAHSLADTQYERREVTLRVHGADGIGDAGIETSTRSPEKEDAVDFIINAARTYGKNVTLVCVGPLTNLAHAYQKDPEAVRLLDEIVIMGGALTVPGNTTPFAEANIIEDAEAAKIILESALPLKIVGLDVTMRTYLTQEQTNQWLDFGTKRAELVAKMTEYYFTSYQETMGMPGCALHDPLAVALALYPDLVRTLALNLTVELDEPARGLTIGDYARLHETDPKTEVCIAVHVEEFLARFMKAMENCLSD